MLNFYEKFDLGAIFDFLDFQKGTSWDTFLHKRSKKRFPGKHADCPGSDPAFHETIVITVPLGPTGFSKRHFFDGDLLILILSAFLCAMFYMPCLSHLLIIEQKLRAVVPFDF